MLLSPDGVHRCGLWRENFQVPPWREKFSGKNFQTLEVFW